jgi:hypothetical protein
MRIEVDYFHEGNSGIRCIHCNARMPVDTTRTPDYEIGRYRYCPNDNCKYKLKKSVKGGVIRYRRFTTEK